MEHITDYLTWAAYAIAAASAAAAALPQGGPVWWQKARAVIDFLAVNFGNAKNLPRR